MFCVSAWCGGRRGRQTEGSEGDVCSGGREKGRKREGDIRGEEEKKDEILVEG